MSVHSVCHPVAVRLVKHWWARLAVYAAVVLVAGWGTYRVAYRWQAGPNPVDSEREGAFIWGAAWASGVTIALALALVIVEAVRLLRSDD